MTTPVPKSRQRPFVGQSGAFVEAPAEPVSRAEFEALAARVAELEARNLSPDLGISRAPAECEDGSPMPLGDWQPIKAAAPMAGFSSETSLRKHIAKAKRDGTRAWWWFRQGRLWVDLNRAPRKR